MFAPRNGVIFELGMTVEIGWDPNGYIDSKIYFLSLSLCLLKKKKKGEKKLQNVLRKRNILIISIIYTGKKDNYILRENNYYS